MSDWDMSETFKESFAKYRRERLLKECPVCSDLFHGYKAAHMDQQDQLTKERAEHEETKRLLGEAVEEIAHAKEYLESCGYHTLDPYEGDPEYKMWKSFNEFLNKIKDANKEGEE